MLGEFTSLCEMMHKVEELATSLHYLKVRPNFEVIVVIGKPDREERDRQIDSYLANPNAQQSWVAGALAVNYTEVRERAIKAGEEQLQSALMALQSIVGETLADIINR